MFFSRGVMELTILQLLLLLVVVVSIGVLGYTVYKSSYEGFATSSVVAQDCSSATILKDTQMDMSGQQVSVWNMLTNVLKNIENTSGTTTLSDGTTLTDTQAVSLSKTQQATILKDIQQIVRNELVNQKTMTTGREGSDEDANDDSISAQQGREYRRDCPKKDSCNSDNDCESSNHSNHSNHSPDMSKYIRKDSIPCWGCTLE